MKVQGITPVELAKVWCVVPSQKELRPAWLKSRLVKGLSTVAGFWLHPVDAMALVLFLRTVHVNYRITKSKFKRCAVCGRPVLGIEAEKLREQMESSPDGRALPCRPECEADRDSGLWKVLNLNVAA